jgi:hypothetical protein
MSGEFHALAALYMSKLLIHKWIKAWMGIRIVKSYSHQSLWYNTADCMNQLPSWKDNITAQLVNKFPAFYGTRRLLTVFIGSYYRFLFWSTWMKSQSSYRIYSKIFFNIILRSMLMSMKWSRFIMRLILIWKNASSSILPVGSRKWIQLKILVQWNNFINI